MSWVNRGIFIGALALVFIISFVTPGVIGIEAGNFAGLKMFIWTGGLVGIIWFGMEMDAAKKAADLRDARA